MGKENVQLKLYEQKLDIFALLILTGGVISVVVARSATFSLDYMGPTIGGVTLAPVYVGLALIVFCLYNFLARRVMLQYRKKKAIAFAFGIGVGMVVDQANYFAHLGQVYTVALYNRPVNIFADIVLFFILIMVVVWSDEK